MNLAPMPEGSRPDRTPRTLFPTASTISGSAADERGTHRGRQGHLLLCDLTLMSAAFLTKNPSSRPIRVLFDPDGLLAAAQIAASPSPYSPDRLLPTIHEYWVYAYLNGKYWKRSDLDKLLYVQSTLFQTHVKLLHALHPGEEWSWWPVIWPAHLPNPPAPPRQISSAWSRIQTGLRCLAP